MNNAESMEYGYTINIMHHQNTPLSFCQNLATILQIFPLICSMEQNMVAILCFSIFNIYPTQLTL